jgi:hypothetical protein
MNNLKKSISYLILLVLAGLLSLGVRGWWETVSEFDQAEKALNRGEMTAAVLHFEKVVLWDFSFFEFRNKALKRMETIRQKAQSDKNPILEGVARDAQAFALVSTDGLHRGRENGSKSRVSLPNHFWSWMVGVSLITWIGLAFLFIFFFFENNLTIANKKWFALGVILLVFFIALWLFSIARL